MPFVETADGTTLFYNDWGAGAPVVFIHGFTLSSDIWEYQMPFTASRGLRCIAYDRRGHGRSSQPWNGYDFDTFVEQLDLRGVTLAAHSMGGGEVARYLSRHGAGRIARVVLVAPVTPFLLKTADNPDGLDRSFFDMVVDGLRNDRPGFYAATAPALFGERVSPELAQWALQLALQASPKAVIDCVRAYSETDFRPDMCSFNLSTLIIHGDADQSAPIDLTSRKTAQAIPGSKLMVYEGAPHGLFITDKDRFNRDLLEFIRS